MKGIQSMNIKDFYAVIKGDYNSVLSRFPNESFACNFIFKFSGDDSFSMLCDALSADDYENAFRAAHTLKGLCLNLGFSVLGASAGEMAEALRSGNYAHARRLIDRVTYDYNKTVTAIDKLDRF